MFVNPMFSGANGPPIFVASSSVGDFEGDPLPINKPAGVIEGDLMIALSAGSNGVSWSGDTGWTEIFDLGSNPAQRVAYKVAGGSEPSTYTFTPASSIVAQSHIIIAYRRAEYVSIGSANYAGSGSPITAPSVTASAANMVAIALFVNEAGGALSSITSGWSILESATPGTTATPHIWSYSKSARGETGDAVLAFSGTASKRSGIQLLIKRT